MKIYEILCTAKTHDRVKNPQYKNNLKFRNLTQQTCSFLCKASSSVLMFHTSQQLL